MISTVLKSKAAAFVYSKFVFLTYVSIGCHPVSYISLSSKEELNTLDGFLDLEFIMVN